MPGREYLAIPGPSVMPDEVLQAMHRGAPNIYEGALVEMVAQMVPDLRAVARTKGHVAMYIGNGHAAWEASLANTVAPGQKVLVPATGRFGHGWAEMAEGLGLETQILDFGQSAPVDLEQFAVALAQDHAQDIKAVLAVHVDTSSSVRSDVAGMRRVLDELGHPALLMADCIASLACDPFEMDAWGVDVAITGSQKGLMVPPGMCFVFFNDRAAEARKRVPLVSRYWDWAPRADPDIFAKYWCGTAPTHHLFGLKTALDMLMAEGMEAVWARHARHAHAIWAACEIWSEGQALRLNVADRAYRSHAVTSLELDQGRAGALRSWVEQNLSLTLGIGLGMAEPGTLRYNDFFRLGHMGHVNGHMIMGLLGGVEAGLRSLSVPIGAGALEAAADVIAAEI